MHLSNVGPRQDENNGLVSTLSDGPLGGFYWDKNLIKVFVTNAVNLILAQVVRNTPARLDPRPRKCPVRFPPR